MLKAHKIDPKTGFLTPDLGCQIPHFNADQKTLFLAYYAESFNLSKAARAVHTNRVVVSLHLKEDPKFREAVENVKEEILDEVEENLYKQSKKSPIAAMQLLKAKRSIDWGVKKGEAVVDTKSDKLKALLNDPN